MVGCLKKIVQLQHGDIIAIRGNGVFSDFFASVSTHDQRYSHVGLIEIDQKNHAVWVIHSEADELSGVGFVLREPLALFLKKSNRLGIFRTKFSSVQKDHIIQMAKKLYENKTPFDIHFTLDDHLSAVYCSEFVWGSILNATQTDIIIKKTMLNHKFIITIEDILHNPYINEIE